MDFNERIISFCTKVKSLKEKVTNEQAVKHSLVMPFFQILGYDVFNPEEFYPEFTADFGKKKGEKVDYAIFINNDPLILIEAKALNEDLNKHGSQLFRYFSTTTSKFGILTNGIEYRFYTDLEEPNKMDSIPFLTINLESPKDIAMPELKKFHKEEFNVTDILDSASDLKYLNLIKECLKKQINEPDDDFTRTIINSFHQGTKTAKIIDKFKPMVKKSFNLLVSEKVNERIQNALEQKDDNEKIDPDKDIKQPEEHGSNIETTHDEIGSYHIVKNILKDNIDPNRLIGKDTQSYYTILIDNKVTQWICRFCFNSSKKILIIPDNNKNQQKFEINSIYEIENYKDQLIEAIKIYV